jgi:hypothetical protein
MCLKREEADPCNSLKYVKAFLCQGLRSGQNGFYEGLMSNEQTNVL